MAIRIWIAFFVAITLTDPLLAADPGITDTEIRLGMVNAQSGAASGLGQGMLAGAEAIFKEVNANGGIHGRKINLIVLDDQYDPNKAIDATLNLIGEQKVFSLFGYVGTPTANAVLPIVRETKTPLIGLFSGAMTLRRPVIPEVINIRASYDDESEMLVEHFIKDKGAKRFAVVYQNDGFGLAVLAGTERALKQRGMEIIAKGTFRRGTTAIKSGLAAMLESNPDVVIMAGPYTPLAAFVKEARIEKLKASLATVSFVGTDNLVQLVGADGDGIVISQVVPFPRDDKLAITKECAMLLAKHAPGMILGFVNLEGCITAKTLVIAMEKAGPALTRASLIQAFESIKALDIGGMQLNLSPENHQASSTVFLTQIIGGQIAQIKAVANKK
ncbi:ABC transporter substrate-binding protein [Undibacterium sp.]|jgi:branched-chain amino acid transport system substrate-binding protein|uniref:ABC transporter substrate-binding protein n=1 Tax=Undibacterium sp. TaxID=1914977 RepID=UPI002C232B51|nr:ABC transporter substrate-binding protein [Undibacterium sp.]HTD06312.1 ABC transporter substrate-binding protein [Undibacterium sp.]